jgi:hypothetical protein
MLFARGGLLADAERPVIVVACASKRALGSKCDRRGPQMPKAKERVPAPRREPRFHPNGTRPERSLLLCTPKTRAIALARRLRSRRRRAAWLCRSCRGPKPHNELDCTDLGRQRDLAGVLWSRPPRGVPPGFCDHHTRCVFSDPGDADRARIPGRRL